MEARDERPAYVRFEKRPLEDRNASIKAGHWVGTDQEFVLITPPGSKDCVERLVADWLPSLDLAVKDGRLTAGLAARYNQAYEFWKKGEEIPLTGTAIKGWPVLSPAQQKTCIDGANIRTVEDLAQANGEALTRLGMGAHEMVQKAQAWLKAATSLGTVVALNAALTTKVMQLEGQIKALEARNAALAAQVQAQVLDKTPA